MWRVEFFSKINKRDSTFIREIRVSLMVFSKYIPISNRPFIQMISPREEEGEGGMWTLERKSLFANKIHASSHEERRLHELFFERCCHLLL